MAMNTNTELPGPLPLQSVGERALRELHGKLKHECLEGEIFFNLKEGWVAMGAWRQSETINLPSAVSGLK
jgi:hypothetical protein